MVKSEDFYILSYKYSHVLVKVTTAMPVVYWANVEVELTALDPAFINVQEESLI